MDILQIPNSTIQYVHYFVTVGSTGMVAGVSMSELLKYFVVEAIGELARSKELSSCNTGGGVSA